MPARFLLILVFLSNSVAIALDQDRPNILFFLSDDQRADFMGCAGHSILQTPTMDRLAAQGVRFENAFVTTSICAASRASILTGLHERTHKYTFGTPPISKPHSEASYPAILKQAGYRTGFVGKFGVSVGKGGAENMFDVFKPLNRNPYHKLQDDGSRRHLSEIAGDHAIEFLKGSARGTPFCLSVSFNAPHAEDGDKQNHYPWPVVVDGLYEDISIPAPRHWHSSVFEGQPEFLRESMNRDRWFWRWDTPTKYEKNVKAYYRMISGIDQVMGRVLAALKKQGFAENTVVIFSGDNGYYKGSRGFAGKWSHYEESLRVPLIVFDPRNKANPGKLNDNHVLNIDIPATILKCAGVDLPKHYQGASLMPFVNEATLISWRKRSFHEHLFDNTNIPKWEGIRGERYVYARYFQQSPPFEFLHDLKVDPDQLRNFAKDPKYVQVLARMRQHCESAINQYGSSYSLEDYPTKRYLKAQKARE